MSIYDLKPKFQNLLRPTVVKLAQRGVSANQVTLLACVISVVLGLFLTALAEVHWLFILIPIWLFIRMALNAIDGMLAREFHQKSRLGGYLNEITDVVSDAALYLPFACIFPFDPLLIGLIIWLAALTELCGILGQVQGQTRRYDGPLGKSDRAFLFGVLGLAYTFYAPLPEWLYWVAWLVVLLLILTCIKRVRAGLAELPNQVEHGTEKPSTDISSSE
ncbi:CDP-alcohol phosphatidyltransferase family protein [Pasteurella multocida]|uniref:CDP-alcohol phosphatidyltransferase family protein n=1 Tax=Pasteurella multocida TaxID=747 RepID=UPI0009582009|nr:CDP-alcohol phosphatidyltransferase family protein [Pasteurella multocida]APW55839.1 inner membrane protein YnbA [Pasteurella multocida subsp. multocida str. HN07]AUL52719.1 CDP-alcohol phosphatidyltransferase [Pasteurella multocida]MEE3713205.1 CDP-alcohol phosphatidyltransferase family protein [Pasteurella multocida]NNI13274.1 CDP-alcohol phosphatidyltransferase family protein [Pasteurella multocida]NNI17528.1 CDP-alcohol phosphatidyltransferase family protein [Pasteurella multocida]